jgi:hypothetical protein
MDLASDGGRGLPTFTDGSRRYVLGQSGDRYQIRIVNPTSARIEAVVSVDGLDAVDGQPASLGKRGYIIPAYGETTIDGWRTSMATVAAFRFSSVGESYAGRKGRDRNVGVIGVAFFPERPPPAVWRSTPTPQRLPPAPSPTQDYESAAPQGSARGASSAGGAGSDLSASAMDSAQPAAPPSASKSEGGGRARAAARPGLGTQFGESQESRVVETTFTRASATPSTVAELRYDDRAGLIARGIPVDPPRDPRAAENERRDRAQAFPEPRFAQPPP